MKNERNVRRSRAAGRRWQPVAILLAAVLMVLSVPLGLRPAFAVNLGDCSLTVNPGNSMIAEDLEDANVVIDLYRVADAIEISGYDTYDWEITEPFSSITIDKKIDSEGWKSIAKQAADIVLGTAPDGETEWKPESADAIDASLKSTGNKAGEKIEGLKAGLYLIVAHGSDETRTTDVPEKYAAVATGEAGAASGTVTVANSHTHRYEFNPELVSLPTKDAIKDADGNDVINTANPGDWIYDATVTLKPSQIVRKGSLDITKTLIDYAQREKEVGNARIIKDPATFIFEVTAYEKQGSETVIYHDYVSIVFDSYGKKSVLIKDLPVDSYVKVREVYSSEVYSLEEEEKNQTILADQNVGVEFENEFEERNPGGGSVTNRFSYTEKDGWESSAQVADDTEESIQNPIQPLNPKN